METDILIRPFEYPLLLDEILIKGAAYRRDRSGKRRELIFDLDGIPHRRDDPSVYVKWKVKTLEDLALVTLYLEDSK